jgi:exodeoxyribonuclease VII large subunit
MQGDRVEESVIAALDSIISDDTQWDVVVIIRGGGATSDLSGFDTYLLATNCAQFPLPIITGIGHERDDTVLDVVAHTRVKTPTAAAEFLIARLVDAADALNAQVEALAHVVNMRMRSEEQRLTQIAAQLPFLFSLAHTRQMHRIEQLESHLRTSLKQLMVKETHRLQLIEQVTESASPQLMLQRGYSITRCNGKVVRDASILSPGVLLTTEFADGMVQSEVRTPQN